MIKMNGEETLVLDFKNKCKIIKVNFHKRTNSNEIPIEIEYMNNFVRQKNTFIYSNGMITNTITSINNVLIEKVGEYIRGKMNDNLKKELVVYFGKLHNSGVIYYANISFYIFDEIIEGMLFEKIPSQTNICLVKEIKEEGYTFDKNAYSKKINVMLDRLISVEEQIFLLNNSENLQEQYKKIVEDVVLSKFKETKEYKIRCLYDKEFERHFKNN
jgi:hypothetical protein